MSSSVIVGGARTPIGKFGGGLSSLPAVSLGAKAIRQALTRSGVDPVDVGYVIMGHVIQAGAGQITARQAAIEAGIPKEVPAITHQQGVSSGTERHRAGRPADPCRRARRGRRRRHGVDVAGALPASEGAHGRAHGRRRDGGLDGPRRPVVDVHQAAHGRVERRGQPRLGIGREEQDAWAARSHTRAQAAWESGRMAEEVVPVEMPQRKGDPLVVARDEGIRADTTPESLAALRPAFGGTGRSPRATRRRSRTAARRSWSCRSRAAERWA